MGRIRSRLGTSVLTAAVHLRCLRPLSVFYPPSPQSTGCLSPPESDIRSILMEIDFYDLNITTLISSILCMVRALLRDSFKRRKKTIIYISVIVIA